MSGDRDQVSSQTVRKLSKKIRDQYGDREQIVGQCDYMAYDLVDELVKLGIDRGMLTVEQRRIGPDGAENHYILVVNPECLSDVDTEMWVDLSLDQFCDHNKSSGLVEVSLGEFTEIESIRLINGNDNRRDEYMSVKKFFQRSLGDLDES